VAALHQHVVESAVCRQEIALLAAGLQEEPRAPRCALFVGGDYGRAGESAGVIARPPQRGDWPITQPI
jgi:hypothetical protein